METANRSAAPPRKAGPPASRISRRAFLSEAAASVILAPALLRAYIREPARTVLHVASRTAAAEGIHTFALTAQACRPVDSTVVDSFAAFAVHPTLPMLYMVRGCGQWKDLPRDVIETYAVSRCSRSLRLLTQTPMALSAIGSRALAVSACGQHLLVSASTGGAWNAFALNPNGLPKPIAIPRKETGTDDLRRMPTPHGLAFSSSRPIAIGVDPGTERLSLLQPSSEAITVLDRCRAPFGLALIQPTWMADGRHVIAAADREPSLLVYAVNSTSQNPIQLIGIAPTATPVRALVADPLEPAIFTARPDGHGSLVEIWELHREQLHSKSCIRISEEVVALASHAGRLWVATQEQLIGMSVRRFGDSSLIEVELPIKGAQAILVQKLPA